MVSPYHPRKFYKYGFLHGSPLHILKKNSNMEHTCTHKLFGILIGVFTPLLIKKIDKLIVPSTLTSLCV